MERAYQTRRNSRIVRRLVLMYQRTTKWGAFMKRFPVCLYALHWQCRGILSASTKNILNEYIVFAGGFVQYKQEESKS